MSKLLLIAVLLLAAFLRLYKITEIPALNADEAAIGYNAYSLLKTGMDEHGQPWPLVFKSFGDYKPGVYFYLILPFIQLLGLNVLAVRLPAVLLSIANVYVIYLFTKKLIPEKNSPNYLITQLPLITTFLLAISPWHLHFSRGGWETQVATFFLLLGTYYFLKALKQPPYFIAFTIFFILSIYTYHSMRVIAPLMGLGLILIYHSKFLPIIHNSKFIIHEYKWQIISIFLGVVLMIPFIISLTSESGLARAQGVSIFADPGPLSRVNQLRGEHPDFNTSPVKVLHNKYFSYTLATAENYLEHFSGNFLFLQGDDIQRNKVPDFGQLYIVSAPFLLIGLLSLLINLSSPRRASPRPDRGSESMVGDSTTANMLNKNSKKIPTLDSDLHRNDMSTESVRLILIWLLIAPLAAALTFQSPHALRAFNMVIPLTLITAVGISSTLKWLQDRIASKFILYTLYFLLFTILIWDFTRYFHQYYTHMIHQYPFSSQYGFSELVPWTESQKTNYDNIFITDRYDQPYILFLFYSQYPPSQFQSQVILTPRDQFGFSTVRQYDNYHFESINYPLLKELYPNSLVIGTDEEIPSDASVIHEITLPGSDHVIFQISKT